jgi:hypothetical protein
VAGGSNPSVAGSAESLRVEIELLERMLARVDERRRPEDQRLRRAIATLIEQKQGRLARSEGRGS